jgi:peptidoglycan hydrolase-like protein with peptidoglycan-binding domain
VTSITTVGTTIGNGDVLYTIDGQAVIALVGPLPAWRSLSTASPAGPDVEELQKALIALGYDPAGDVTPSETFDAATQAMVERWQAGQSLPVTGQVALGSVVFIPKAMTVLAVSHTVGDAVGDGDVVVTLAGSSQQVQIIAPTNDQPYLVPGFKVDLGSAGTGTVTSLNSVTQSGTAAVQVVIAPSSPIGGVANGGSVTVTLNIDVADHVLIVPAQALASRLDGSYAVEVKSADGSVHWTPVHFVAVAGLNVGITASGLGAGTVVLMPQE